MSTVDDTVKLIRELPAELQAEVADFARFLKESGARPRRTRFGIDWASAGRDRIAGMQSEPARH